MKIILALLLVSSCTVHTPERVYTIEEMSKCREDEILYYFEQLEDSVKCAKREQDSIKRLKKRYK
jgi:hypothetical protein